MTEVLARRKYHVLSGKGSQPAQIKLKFPFESLFMESSIFEKLLQTRLRTGETPTFLNIAVAHMLYADGVFVQCTRNVAK